MKITSINETPVEYFPYWVVQQGGRDMQGNRVLAEVNLPILIGKIQGLGRDIDAIIACSDLQGSTINNGNVHLLGEKLPEFLSMFLGIEFPNLNTNKIGVILCGDLYADTEKRGGAGDVKAVWYEFKKYFKWVAGVAGNHDDFGNTTDFEYFKKQQNIHYLHKQIKQIDTLKIAGISGIIGKPDKPQRVDETAYLKTLKELLLKQPDFVLLHEGPDTINEGFEGNPKIRQTILASPPNTVFCGHSHWTKPLATLENKTQVVNLDGRAIIFINEK